MAKRFSNLLEAPLPTPSCVDAFVTITEVVNDNLSHPAAQVPVFGGMVRSRKPSGFEGTQRAGLLIVVDRLTISP